jgi:hypothetical protein
MQGRKNNVWGPDKILLTGNQKCKQGGSDSSKKWM